MSAQAPDATKPGIAKRFAGSSFLFRNMTGLTTFYKDTNPTWNPENSLAILMRPRFALTDKLWVAAWQYTNLELTNSDSTTRRNEVSFSDTTLNIGYTVLKDKATGLTSNVDFHVSLPTSKGSQARTMLLGAGVGGSLSWHKGIVSVAASTRADHMFNRYKTGNHESSWADAHCIGGECGGQFTQSQFTQTGVRNSEWRVVGIGSLSVDATDWLSFSASAGEIADFLPKLSSATAPTAVGGGTVAPDPDGTNWRALMYWGLGAEVRVHPSLGIGIGVETYNAQLKPDSTYQRPFFNQATAAYVELSVSPDKLPFW